MRIGINGMGRIGRLALRAGLGGAHRGDDDPRRGNRLDVVHVNEIKGGAEATAHLLEFDSVQGRWRTDISQPGETAITVSGNEHRLLVARERRRTFHGATSASTSCWNAPASS